MNALISSSRAVNTANVCDVSTAQELQNKTHDGDFNLKNSTDNIEVNSTLPWRTISVSGAIQAASTNPCASRSQFTEGINDYDAFAFDDTSQEECYINFHMPQSWDGGPIQFRFDAVASTSISGNTFVEYEMAGVSYASPADVNTAVGAYVGLAATFTTSGRFVTSPWSGMVSLSGGPAAGERVHLKVRRDVGTDDLVGDAYLTEVQIRFLQGQYSD